MYTWILFLSFSFQLHFFYVFSKYQAPSTDNVPVRFGLKKQFFSVPLPVIIGTVAFAAEAYANIPLRAIHGSNPNPLPPHFGDSVLLVFPGSGGPDIFTDLLMKNIKIADEAAGIKRFSYLYNWLEWRGNFFRAAYDGDTLGTIIGTQLAQEESINGKLRSLHVIGISVGAFPADACCRAYKQVRRSIQKNNSSSSNYRNNRSNSFTTKSSKELEAEEAAASAHVQLTLLDPFDSKGVYRTSYGFQNFGNSANYCDMFLNSDDPVPFTNTPLPLAFTYDITNAASKKLLELPAKTSYHCWPVAYYASNWKTTKGSDGRLALPSHDATRPRGGKVDVP